MGSSTLLNNDFVLANNIDASGTVNWNSGAGFTPIGGSCVQCFNGILDGQFHTIDGLRLTTGGLFSQIGTNGTVRNLTLSNVAANSSLAVVGALASENSGTISNVSISSGTVSYAGGPVIYGGLVGQNSGTITLSSASAAVNGGPAVTGGLVGDNSGTIEKSFATGAVTSAVTPGTGGLVGLNSGTISQSFASGTVNSTGSTVGGLVGYDSGTIKQSFAVGSVHGRDTVGGLVGTVVGGSVAESYATGLVSSTDGTQSGGLVGSGGIVGVANSYWDTQSTGQATSAGGTGLTTRQLIAALPSGFDPTVWAINPGVSYPYLRWQPATTIPIPIYIPPALIPITVTAGNLSIVYGTPDPTLTYQITSGSLSGSAAFSGTLARAPGQNVGTYAITLGTLTLPSMYTLTYVGGMLTITPASLTITADSTSRQVGAANPAFTASYSGFVAGDGPSAVSGLTLSTPATTSSPAGTYSINPGGASALNYKISYVNGVLTVTAAPPTPPPPPTPTPPPASVLTPLPPPITQITQITSPVNNVVTIPPPILASLTPPSSPAASPPTGTGSYANATPGTPTFIPPPLPGRSIPGPNGETRSSVPPPGENRFFQNQVLLQLGLDIPDAELTRIAQQLGLRIITSDTLTTLGRKVIRLELPSGMSVRDAIRRLEANRLVSVAAPIYQFHLMQAAGATSKGDAAQYMLGALHLDKAHAIATGKGITIALIDSEVDKQHTELQGTISEELDTLGVNEPLPSHGTEMAGAIVSHDRLMGVAPGAKILVVRAFGESNSTVQGTTLSILKGIEWAESQGARIINMSFAGPRDPSLERAFKAAHDKGIVLIAAAGNAGPKSPPLYPGADSNVIAVTATDARDRVFRGANQGPQLSVAAPGVDIIAPAPAGGYQMSTGTSIATAHVSGVVSLMLERDPTLKPDDVRKILESTASNLGSKGKNGQFGWGLVNPPKALEAVAAQIKSSDASSKNR